MQLLGKLHDPHSICPSMAVALLTTLNNAVLANIGFSLMTRKLMRKSTEEAALMSVYMMGTGSLGGLEKPRRLETLLNIQLPPSKRMQIFD